MNLYSIFYSAKNVRSESHVAPQYANVTIFIVTDVNILIKNIGYTRYIKQHTNRLNLIFYPTDNSAPIIKTITGCAESSNNTETISLDSSFGVIKKPTDFKAISFLTYCRMDQDAFELTWHSDSIATMTFRVREVLK